MYRSLLLLALCLSLNANAESLKRVPAGLLQIPPGVGTILIAETATATLRRFVTSDTGLVQVDTSYMSIGRNGVGKDRAWDRKTPLGIYFITEELSTERLHEKYGEKAFALDYPNAWDRNHNRTGDGIWLHGVDRRSPERPPRDTDGCLSLPNEFIAALADELSPLVTPVIVTREFSWAPTDEVLAQREKLSAALERWKLSVERNDVFTYLELYAEDFHYRGMVRGDWALWRNRVFARHGPLSLELRDVLLIADPEEPGLFLSRFTQRVQTGQNTVETQKRLYWRANDAGNLRIVAEDNG